MFFVKRDSFDFSIFKFLGVTPFSVLLSFICIVISAIVLGLLISKNSFHVIGVKSKKIFIGDNIIKTKLSRDLNLKNRVGVSGRLEFLDKKDFVLYNSNKLKFILNDKDKIKPKIAIVIDDMGIDFFKNQKILKLPGIYTLSYLTYVDNLQSKISYAKSLGREVLLHVPMEAEQSFSDKEYGGDYLKVSNGMKNIKILKNILNKTSGYMGLNNHMGSKFTSDYNALFDVIAELYDRGLMFFDSKTSKASKGDLISKSIILPYVSRDVFLDDSNELVDINKNLKLLEKIALKYGSAVAIGHPRENTINALNNWIQSIENRGFILVPLSTIVDDKFKNKKS